MEILFLILLVLVVVVFVLPITAYSMASRAKDDAQRAVKENRRMQIWVGRLDERIQLLEDQWRGGGQGEHEETDQQVEAWQDVLSDIQSDQNDPAQECSPNWPDASMPTPPEPPPTPIAPGPVVSAAKEDPSGRAVPKPAQIPTMEKRPSRLDGVNWEHFMGVKLFAWIGGLALFLGVAFFLKYAFDRNLIPPTMRAALGFAAGFGLLGGGFKLDRKKFKITSHTLCATGILVLYATTFACRSVYHFEWFGLLPTFLMMALITAVAFLLAVRLDALIVAVLGLAGGFLTPVLLEAGFDHPLALFGYIALLDLGLVLLS